MAQKPHTSYDQQIDILRSRGMIINDIDFAKRQLRHINYYRFGLYSYEFRVNPNGDNFRECTKFESVIELYDFDNQLRFLVMAALAPIELSFRAQWAHRLSEKSGSHAHLDRKIHASGKSGKKKFAKAKSALKKEINRSQESFIRRQIAKYKDPTVWAVSEIMSFGLVSRWFGLLTDDEIQSNLETAYHIDQGSLRSWIHRLSVVRNHCAHHARLWNRNFNHIRLKRPKEGQIRNAFTNKELLYNNLVIILYLLDQIDPDHIWRERFIEFFTPQPPERLEKMGFPKDWQTHPVWHEN